MSDEHGALTHLNPVSTYPQTGLYSRVQISGLGSLQVFSFFCISDVTAFELSFFICGWHAIALKYTTISTRLSFI